MYSGCANHGAAIDGSSKREAVPIELPAADDRAGLPQYAATVARGIDKRDPDRVVLVAQSPDGFTVPLVCKRM